MSSTASFWANGFKNTWIIIEIIGFSQSVLKNHKGLKVFLEIYPPEGYHSKFMTSYSVYLPTLYAGIHSHSNGHCRPVAYQIPWYKSIFNFIFSTTDETTLMSCGNGVLFFINYQYLTFNLEQCSKLDLIHLKYKVTFWDNDSIEDSLKSC